jgi:hypothetical protein
VFVPPSHPRGYATRPGQDGAAKEVVFLGINKHGPAIGDLEFQFVTWDTSQERVIMVPMRGEHPVAWLDVFEDMDELAFVAAAQV